MTSPSEAAIPRKYSIIASSRSAASCSFGSASCEIRITPSVSVSSARHLRYASWRLSMRTEKVAVVNTFICAMIENVDASRCCSAMKPRMFITR